MNDPFIIGGVTLTSRLFIGTGKYGADSLIPSVAEASGAVIARELERTRSQSLQSLETCTLLVGAIARVDDWAIDLIGDQLHRAAAGVADDDAIGAHGIQPGEDVVLAALPDVAAVEQLFG